MKTRNRTKYTVLGMLALENMTGYEINKTIQASTNYFWSESEGQIYPALAQCVTEELASYKEKKSEKSNRLKKVYSITAKGRKELNAWLKKESQPALARNELLLKLFFGGNIDVGDNIHHIIHRQREIENELASYQKLRTEIMDAHATSIHSKYWLITLDYGLKSLKAELAWCKETLTILQK